MGRRRGARERALGKERGNPGEDSVTNPRKCHKSRRRGRVSDTAEPPNKGRTEKSLMIYLLRSLGDLRREFQWDEDGGLAKIAE